ncbi:prepilin peptidase [Candidatus Poriferisodalis sp.]|uniref:prepilin peptidase n=1 Tax=Candidatus Poriferisodalis sp. TaxID=3101277 RepID=UPI003B0130FD
MSTLLVWAAVTAWGAMGVYVMVADLRSGRIPRRAVWPAGAAVAVLLGGAAALAGDPARFGWAVGAATAIALALELAYRRWPDRMGFGDVRLIVVNSLLAGWWGPAWALWALMAGALAQWPAAVAALVRHGRSARVRWAPGLVTGTAAVVAWRLWADGALPS